eukprot:g64202.t1
MEDLHLSIAFKNLIIGLLTAVESQVTKTTIRRSYALPQSGVVTLFLLHCTRNTRLSCTDITFHDQRSCICLIAMATTFQESLEAHENSRPAWVVTDEDERLWGEGLAYPSAPISSKAALQGFLEAKRRVAAGVPMDGGETNPSVLRHAGSGLVSTNPVAAGYAYEDVRNNRETLGLSK